MKKIKNIIMIIMMLFSVITLPVQADIYLDEHSYFEYQLNYQDEVVLLKYHGNEEIVKIPNEIDGYDVIAIASETFVNNPSLKKLIISENIETIAHDSVYDCAQFEAFEVDQDNPYYASYQGMLTNKTKDTLIKVPYGLPYVKLDNQFSNFNDYAFAYCDQLKVVILGNNVQTISRSCFLDCTSLTSISIPSCVRVIADNAFSGCTSLKEVTFNEGLQEIKLGAFNNSDVIQLKFPNSLKTIESGAFQDCKSLQAISIAAYLENIDAGAFAYCNQLKSIKVNSNNAYYRAINNCLYSKDASILYLVSSDLSSFNFDHRTIAINAYAFVNNQKITSLTIPSEIYYVGSYAFENSSITQMTFDRNITSLGGGIFKNSKLQSFTLANAFTSLPSEMFAGCSNLTYVSLPNGMELIGDDAFRDCSKLASITLPSSIKCLSDQSFLGCKSLSYIQLPNELEFIGTNCFSTTKLSNIAIGEYVEYIGMHAFYNCPNLTNINVNHNNINYSSYNGSLYDKQQETLYCMPMGNHQTTFAPTLKCIAANACSGNGHLKEVILPNGLMMIEEEAFSYCRNLTNIHLPNGIQTIKQNAFYSCEALKSLTLPASLVNFDAKGYEECFNLISIDVDDDNLKYASYDGVLYDRFFERLLLVPKKKNTITFANGVKTIAKYAFACCNEFTSIELNDSIETIEESAFIDCLNLKAITLPKSLTKISKHCFDGCEQLSNIVNIDHLQVIDDYAFANTALTQFEINDDVRQIAHNAFVGCINLKQFNVSKQNQFFASYEGVIYDKEYHTLIMTPIKLAKLTIHPNTICLASHAFYQSELETIRINEGITMLGSNVFVECFNLKNIVLPSTLNKIHMNAFMNCLNIKQLYVLFSEADYKNVNGYNNDAFKQAKITYLGSMNQDSIYQDVKKTDWFYQVVVQATNKKYMSSLKSIEDLLFFGPDESLSRGMVVTILYRMANQPKVSFKTVFHDLNNPNLWYSNAIIWASENKIVKGYDNGYFGVDDPITRQDLAIMIRNYANHKHLNVYEQASLNQFADQFDISNYASSAIAWCVNKGIINGSVKDHQTYLKPLDYATRAEAAKMFLLLSNLIVS